MSILYEIQKRVSVDTSIDVNYRVITLILNKYGNLPPLFGELCIILVTPNFYNYFIYISIKVYNFSRRTIG